MKECQTALVWNELEAPCFGTQESSKSYLCRSALDLLPCFPSELPTVQCAGASEIIVKELQRLELNIKDRSVAVESHWSFDKCQQSKLGEKVWTQFPYPLSGG
ncbi:unnamed protein product [Soboliphyme baturini]|uniref:Med12-LCEWAV domain-containing protein n=1 Tax=Soboliphyme baturini TaxID=241478 RepID=A0A183J9U7_9BILA|nr:unnamed protein product [Soboliphyme baturini]